PKSHNIIMAGIMLPATPKIVAVIPERPKLIPRGMPNFISTKGIMEASNVEISAENIWKIYLFVLGH
ncbi:MAG: hypothetical protein PHP74_01580, partial [Candidatus Gracilibacteria bacterium]|nr:hypothetical protein [Candidatus Gracilibacteria bacterium]